MSSRALICAYCGDDFVPERYYSNRPNRYCKPKCFADSQRERRLGKMKAGLEATEHPTMRDIAWAAGVFEGEGSISFERGSQRCQVAQKEPWLLERLKALFGGTIVEHINTVTPSGRPSYRSDWKISGARARGFLMTMYPFLSPRRQARIREVFQIPHI